MIIEKVEKGKYESTRKAKTMRDKSTLEGYTKEEIKLADELLRFLAKRNPREKRCSFIEPSLCSACNEKIEAVRFLSAKLKASPIFINNGLNPKR